MGRHRKVETAIAEMMSKRDSARADYQATKRSRFNRRRKGLPAMGGSGDYHIRSPYDFYSLIESCYDLERNDAVVGQLVDRRSTNIIQSGFRLEPDTGDKKLNADVKARWKEWADDPDECDLAGEACFSDFEYSADWTSKLAGDCGITLTEDGPLQFFEPFLIRHDHADRRDIFLGVEIDEDRWRHRYYVAEDSVDPYDITFTNFSPIESRDATGLRQFFHIYNNKRTTLTRGISAFAPIFELTGMLEDVNFAKLVQQQIVSCIAFLVEESETASGLPSTGKSGIGSEKPPEDIPNTRGRKKLVNEVEPAMEVNPGAGKKVTGFSPQVPNPEFFQQYRLILQLICGNLDLPLAVGMLDGSETNFHGFIGSINEAKKLWARSQDNLAKRFHRPCYRGKLRHFIAEDYYFRRYAKRLGKKFYQHKWHAPVWKSVKQLEDTNDRLIRLRNAIVSPSKMQAELNVDYESHVDETVKDNALAVRAAKKVASEINSEFQDGQPVHWQQLYPMPTPDGIQATAEVAKDKPLEMLVGARERAIETGDTELAQKLLVYIEQGLAA